MARYPGAIWKPVTRYLAGGTSNIPMYAYRRFQGHTAVSNGSLFSWFNQPGHAVSHFYVLADGDVEQYIDTKYRSSATLDGNYDTITVETEDVGSPFPVWSGSNVPAWTAAQIKSLAKLGAWVHRTHGIPVVLCPSAAKGTKGFSYHRQGIDPWRKSTDERWSKATGKVCPGDRRISQWKTLVIPQTQALIQGDWFDMATKTELRDVVDAALAAERPRVTDAVWRRPVLNELKQERPASTILRFAHVHALAAHTLLQNPATFAAALAPLLPPTVTPEALEVALRTVLGSVDEPTVG